MDEEQEQFFLPLGSIIRDPIGSAYIVEALLGRGGFGAVYLVHEQFSQQRRFALKEEVHTNGYRRSSFAVEADILHRLQHRSLPRVYRFFEDAQRQRSYLLMEYIAGKNLDALRREQPEKRFSLPQALELLAPIVDALIYLHSQNPPIVHRDIKPANIIVPTSHAAAMLVDFGIAKEYVEDRTTNVVRPATPGYAAPEQYDGGTTPRTDLYSLGATFYAVLTGQVPPHALRRAISREADLLQPAHEIVPAIPAGVAEAIARAMALQSEDRFETVEQFWQELNSQAEKQPERLMPRTLPHASPAPPEKRYMEMPPAPARRKPRAPRIQRKSVLAVLVLALLFTIGGSIGALVFDAQNPGAPGVTQRPAPSPTPPLAVCGNSTGARSAGESAEAPPRQAPASAGTDTAPVVFQPALESAIYPRLASTYAGTIYDNLTRQQTALCLLNIQQNQEHIQGTLQGLGLAGTFTGTVTADGRLFFTMPLHSGAEMLVCKGTIKVAGDMTGTFQVYDQQGNFTGESGIWYASVYEPQSRM